MVSKRQLRSISFGALFFSILLMGSLPASANPILTGDSIQGALSTNQGPVDTQFTSPAVVGSGTEFSGSFTDYFSQIWNIFVDIGQSSFTVGIVGSTDRANIASSASNLLEIVLSDLDFTPSTIISSVVNSGYNCISSDYSCTAQGNGPNISGLSFTADSIDVSFNLLRSGETYTFDINPTTVPEPNTIALLGIGLIGIGIGRRKLLS